MTPLCTPHKLYPTKSHLSNEWSRFYRKPSLSLLTKEPRSCVSSLPAPTATQPRRCSRVRDLQSKLPLAVSRVAPRSLPTSAERLHHRLVHADRWVHADLSRAPCRRGSHRRPSVRHPSPHSARAVATPPSPHSALSSAVFRISLGSSSGGSSRRK
jgi:hypothetical protein